LAHRTALLADRAMFLVRKSGTSFMIFLITYRSIERKISGEKAGV
jgi:hypothetical protein